MATNSSKETKGFFDSFIDNAKLAGSVVADGVGKVGSIAVDGVKSAGSVVGDVAGKAVDVGKVLYVFLHLLPLSHCSLIFLCRAVSVL
jgi:hypothetical protein